MASKQGPVPKKTELAKSVKAVLPKEKKLSLDPQTMWDDVEAIYVTCARGVVDIAEFAKSTQTAFTSVPAQDVPRGVVTAVNGLAKDIEQLTTDLCRIHKNHSHRTGEIKDDLEHKLSLDIVQDYIGFQERFKAATLPSILVLTEAMQELFAKDELTNPDVISDAVVKSELTPQGE